MSKYEPLQEWVGKQTAKNLTLTFAEIHQILGFPIDHSFLNYRKELLAYGYQVGKISMKKQTVDFQKASNFTSQSCQTLAEQRVLPKQLLLQATQFRSKPLLLNRKIWQKAQILLMKAGKLILKKAFGKITMSPRNTMKIWGMASIRSTSKLMEKPCPMFAQILLRETITVERSST